MPQFHGSLCFTHGIIFTSSITILALKKAEKELSKLEAKKAAADQKAAEEAKKVEAESVVKKLLASGMSADEILEKLRSLPAAHHGEVCDIIRAA